MASDFQRPRSLIMSVSTLAHRRAVAPPGRRERVESKSARMPVVASSGRAAWRRAFVTNCGLTSCHLRWLGCGL